MVHGAWHGAWYWDRLVHELEAAGHQVTAVDLPSDDPGATFETYAEVVAEHMSGDPNDDVTVVGHSLGGLSIPFVPARARVGRLVYLCALVPVPGSSFADQLASEPNMLAAGYAEGLGEPDAEGRRGWQDLDLAREYMYADCSEDDARIALARMRLQALGPYGVSCALDALPDVPSTYILCSEDRLVNPEWSRRVARDRLNAHVIELPGSHSPFWSRPSDLARVLGELA